MKQWKDVLIIRDNRGRVEYFKDNYGTWQYLEGGTVHVYGVKQHIDENFYQREIEEDNLRHNYN